jgi:hypothetical protein
MLPINTQASSTEDRHIIAASLKRQEEEAYKQTKILEKLADEFSKQRRASTKQNTNNKAETSTKGPGFFDMPLQDLKQMFIFDSGYKNKQNKQNTLKDTSQNFKFDSGQKPNNKQDINNDENNEKKSQGVFKNMIENITDSNAKKEISETRKKLDNIVETPSEGDKVKKSIEIENEETTPTERKRHMPFSQKITNSMAGATTKDFGGLLTTKEYKEFTKKQTDRIIDALEGSSSDGGDVGGGTGGGFDIPGIDIDLPRGKGKPGMPKPGMPKPGTPKPGLPKPGLPPIPPAAAAAAVVTGVVAAGAALTYGATNVLNNMSDEQLEQLSESGGGDDSALAAQAILNGRKSQEEKDAEQKRIEQEQEDLKDAPFLTKYYGIGKEEYMKEMKDKKKKEADKKRVKELVQQSKDKQLKKKQATEAGPQEPLIIPDELKNLETASTVTPKLLDTATEQKQELEDTKAASTPVTIINNNTNNVGGGGGQSMSFASASAVNKDSAINDFFRSHGRIFA